MCVHPTYVAHADTRVHGGQKTTSVAFLRRQPSFCVVCVLVVSFVLRQGLSLSRPLGEACLCV